MAENELQDDLKQGEAESGLDANAKNAGKQSRQAEGGKSVSVEGEGVEKECKDLKDKLLRSYADFDNYRKRADREIMDARERGEERLAFDLLPVLDEFDAAISNSHLPSTAGEREQGGVIEGVGMVADNFFKILSLHGLKEIECVGKKFDSDLHEAVQCVAPKDEKQDGQIVAVVMKGYEFKGRVLRHAKVIVAKKV